MPADAQPAQPNRQRLLSIALLLVLAALVFLFRSRIHFDWQNFFNQLRHISLAHFIAGVALIYASFWLRSARWVVFVSPVKRLPAFSLVGSQFVGFTAVALFGRLADLTRPYLIAKRIELPIASQIAVYTIERMFDLGAAAILFSSALAVTPRTAPHHEIFVRAGIVSLAGTAFLALFAIAIRLFGEQIASLTRSLLGRFSKPLAESVAVKILVFRHGLNAIPSLSEFAAAAALSLAMWSIIGEAYVQTLHAFVQTPELATLPFSRTMLLMAASIGGSLVQLPVIGWFTQIAVTATAMHTLYGAPIEAATACGAVVLIVNLLSIIPIGLLYARLEGTTLQAATRQSTTA
jgi:uncharacterized membrane protein YbhN (UPF0104 family)